FICVTGVSGSGKSSLINDILMERARQAQGRTTRDDEDESEDESFHQIRDLFALLPEAKIRGYKPGRFSFNKPGGRCEACEGNGSNRLEMDFLADVWVKCPVC